MWLPSPLEKKRDTLSEREAVHLRALLTLDFLSQLKARSRDGGVAVTGHVGPDGLYQNRLCPRCKKMREETYSMQTFLCG